MIVSPLLHVHRRTWSTFKSRITETWIAWWCMPNIPRSVGYFVWIFFPWMRTVYPMIPLSQRAIPFNMPRAQWIWDDKLHDGHHESSVFEKSIWCIQFSDSLFSLFRDRVHISSCIRNIFIWNWPILFGPSDNCVMTGTLQSSPPAGCPKNRSETTMIVWHHVIWFANGWLVARDIRLEITEARAETPTGDWPCPSLPAMKISARLVRKAWFSPLIDLWPFKMGRDML
jgi:hypothetical protein